MTDISDVSNVGFDIKYFLRNTNPQGNMYYGIVQYPSQNNITVEDILYGNENIPILCRGFENQIDGSSYEIFISCNLNGGQTYELFIVTDIDGEGYQADFALGYGSQKYVTVPSNKTNFFLST